MYLRGNKWTMNRRKKKRTNWGLVGILLAAIGAMFYVNQVVVPTTPPLFIPTPTPTTSPEAFVNQAEQFYNEGKLQQAVDAYKAAIDADPGNPANYIALSRLQVWTGELDDAILNTQNALLKNPNNPLAHAVQGWALGFQEKYGEAEIEIKKAIDLDPDNALAHAYYAELLIIQGDFELQEKAIQESRTARDLDSSLFETHRARGIVLLNTNNLEEAVTELNAALSINKNIADVHLYLGVTYKALGDYGKAEESLLAAYALNPTDTIALTEISRSYFADGRYRQAAQYAEEAILVEPTSPALHGNLGIAYYKTEEFSKAIEQLGLAVRGGTTDGGQAVEGLPLDYGRVEEYYWYYGFALAKSNRCNEAVPIFQALLTGVPDDDIAVYNANAGIDLCRESLGTAPAPTEEVTPTP
jgi:tetratricopeptide (TPR) repeat protein